MADTCWETAKSPKYLSFLPETVIVSLEWLCNLVFFNLVIIENIRKSVKVFKIKHGQQRVVIVVVAGSFSLRIITSE